MFGNLHGKSHLLPSSPFLPNPHAISHKPRLSSSLGLISFACADSRGSDCQRVFPELSPAEEDHLLGRRQVPLRGLGRDEDGRVG